MAWVKSPPELVALWDEVVPTAPGVQRKPMFGYPAGFANGHMFAGLFQDKVVVRLPAAELAEFMAQPGAERFEPMAGRPMTGYAVVPPALLADKLALSAWLERAFQSAASMPPKEKKAPKKKG